MSTTQDLIDQQGWDDQTMLMFYDEFIARLDLGDAFEAFLTGKAEQENEECAPEPAENYQCIDPNCSSAGTYHDHGGES